MQPLDKVWQMGQLATSMGSPFVSTLGVKSESKHQYQEITGERLSTSDIILTIPYSLTVCSLILERLLPNQRLNQSMKVLEIK